MVFLSTTLLFFIEMFPLWFSRVTDFLVKHYISSVVDIESIFTRGFNSNHENWKHRTNCVVLHMSMF